MTRKILTIQECRQCPFGKTRAIPATNYLEIKCRQEDRMVSGCFEMGKPMPIPAWCPLQDADDFMEAFVKLVSEQKRKEAARG